MNKIADMVERRVARKLTAKEQDSHRGPVHYLNHQKSMKPDSETNPCCIVFDVSATFKGHTLNDYWDLPILTSLMASGGGVETFPDISKTTKV